MNTYSVRPGTFKAYQKKFLLFIGLAVASSFMGAVFVFPFRDRNAILAIITAAALVIIIAAVAINRALKRMREVWSTYSLTIEDDFILKTQSHHSDIKIHRDEIKSIQKSFTGDVAVKTYNWRKFVIIPSSLNGLDEVEHLLARWKPIKITSRKKLFLFLSFALAVFLGILFYVRYYLSPYLFSNGHPNLISFKIMLFIVVALSIIGLWVIRSLPQLDERAKPKRWLFIMSIAYLILLAVSIAISFFITNH